MNASRPQHQRVVVVGTSSAGKSTFAAQLAALEGLPHVELDALYWGPDWRPKPDAVFARLVDDAIAAPAWVVDGNYAAVRERIWSRATTIVWLDYRLPRVLGRGLKRSIARSLRGTELWHGNRESLRQTFLSRRSILLWILKTHGPRRREFAALQASARYPQACWVRFRSPAQAGGWLRDLQEHKVR